MTSTARIAQGLKKDEEVEKTTLSESLNTGFSTFKHLTVKQIFPWETYRLKVHRDAEYLPKLPAADGFDNNKPPASYQIPHRMSLDTEELARRAAIYASLADSMVASVIEELSPKDQRTKLLHEKLAIIQEAQVSTISAGFAAASNLQLLRQDALLKNFGFQPQVRWGRHLSRVLMSWVINLRFSRTGFGPSSRQIGWRARQWPLFRSPSRATKEARKRLPQPRTSLGLQCLSAWVRLLTRLFRGPYLKSSPFVQVAAKEPAADPSQDNARRLGQLLQLPQPGSVDRVQVGVAWQTLPHSGEVCWAPVEPLTLSRIG